MITNFKIFEKKNINDDCIKVSQTPVYHGTFADFDIFSIDKLGTNTGAKSAKEGFFFSSNKNVAISYASDLSLKSKKLEKDAKQAIEKIKELTGDSSTLAQSKLVQKSLYKRKAYGDLIDKKVEYYLKKIIKYDDFVNDVNDDIFGPKSKLAHNGKIKEVYLDINNPFIKDYEGSDVRDVKYHEIIHFAKENGYDSVILKNTYDTWMPIEEDDICDIYIVFDPKQIKNKPFKK